MNCKFYILFLNLHTKCPHMSWNHGWKMLAIIMAWLHPFKYMPSSGTPYSRSSCSIVLTIAVAIFLHAYTWYYILVPCPRWIVAWVIVCITLGVVPFFHGRSWCRCTLFITSIDKIHYITGIFLLVLVLRQWGVTSGTFSVFHFIFDQWDCLKIKIQKTVKVI